MSPILLNPQIALLKEYSASENITRGARKDYKPYWNVELQNLEEAVEQSRKEAETDPSVEKI